MLLKAGLLLLAIWAVGILVPNAPGNLVHLLLFVGLMMLLLGFLKARDAASHRDTRDGAR